MRRLILIIFYFLLSFQAYPQIILPNGGFNKDRIKIGEEFTFSLSIRYLNNKDVVFPDSLFDFSPFELNRKLSFPTRSDSLYSYDSAVYFLTTFELDSFQVLELPIYMVTDGDSLVIRSGLDSIQIIHVVETIPDSIALLSNTSYSNVTLDFNYPYFIVGAVVFILIGLILFFAFGKSIRRQILLYRLTRLHKKFMQRFSTEISKAESTDAINTIPVEVLINDWKSYMEKLNKKPFTKLTTKEIATIHTDNNLRKALTSIDKAIYGNFLDTKLVDSFYYLRTASEESYQLKIRGIKNE